ncbi:MAG TPA: response regulator [Gemmatimonadaceae bacterium]|nr:response regulator [Gemmatimonadaceae bacterium]
MPRFSRLYWRILRRRASPKIPVTPVASPRPPRVLLVDDAPSLCGVMRRHLEARRYEVLCATTAHEALEVVSREAEPPDVLVIDVGLPDMSGRELVHRLAQQIGPTPVLYVSGANATPELTASLRARANFLGKPFQLEELRLRVDAIRAESGGGTIHEAS